MRERQVSLCFLALELQLKYLSSGERFLAKSNGIHAHNTHNSRHHYTFSPVCHHPSLPGTV